MIIQFYYLSSLKHKNHQGVVFVFWWRRREFLQRFCIPCNACKPALAIPGSSARRHKAVLCADRLAPRPYRTRFQFRYRQIKKGCDAPFINLVEAAGIEPASASTTPSATTCLVTSFQFDNYHADVQA